MGGLFGKPRPKVDGDQFLGRAILVKGVPYIFRKRLGQGGFGAVYSATAPNGREVAIKTICIKGLPTEKAATLIESYLNEVKLLKQLQKESRHVVVIYDFDFDGDAGVAYMVMEKGQENLSTLIERLQMMKHDVAPGIDAVMIKEFWRQSVDIIRTIHSHGIVHMDLKPDNLILFGMTLKIADLGISRKANVLGPAGMGTWQFSAPEMMLEMPGVHRYYDPKSDVWSLGAILYYMVYGTPPQYKHFAFNPPMGMRHHPDPALNDMLRRTLVLDPQKRLNINQVLAHPYTHM